MTVMKKPKKPSRKDLWQFGISNVGGTAFFVVGYGVFALLYGHFHWSWFPAKMLGDFIGWTCNFAIQYFVAFREERQGHKPHVVAGKFTVFSLINLGIDYLIVGGLNWLGVSPFVGMIIASQFFSVWKWVWYKWWVFNKVEKT
jgi:putative flippase GtrA